MTSKGIALASQLGFNVLTYKTICGNNNVAHPFPNICYVSSDRQLTHDDIGKIFYAITIMPKQPEDITISNSLGCPCGDPEWVAHDIAQARAALHEGQVLIVSVLGQGATLQDIAQDFAVTAQMAYKAGAQIIELNFSCSES